MATSSSTNWIATRDDIIQQILENCKVVKIGSTPSATLVTDTAKVLNRIVKRLQTEGIKLWTLDWTTQSFLASSEVTGSDSLIYTCRKTQIPNYENKPITGSKYTDNWKQTGSTGGTWAVSISNVLDAAAASDGGDGTVDITITGHGLTTSDRIRIEGTVNYDGEHAIAAVDDVNTISITVPFVAETFTTAMTAKTVYTSIGDILPPKDTIAIDTAFIRRNDTDHPVRIVGYDEYLSISRKEIEGLTTVLWYNEREKRIYLANHPSESTDILHYLRVVLLEDFDSASDDPDFPVRWIDLLVAEGTLAVASKYDLPLEERNWFRIVADSLKRDTNRDDQEKTESKFVEPI